MKQALEHYKININDNIVISYFDNRLIDKKTILFVHGWGCNKETLQSIYLPLSHNYRIISLDLPGFGESSFPTEDSGGPEYAEFVISFLHVLGIKELYYVGHSFGGKLGIILASRKYTLIKRLVLIDSSGLRGKRHIDWYIKVWSYKIAKFFVLKVLRNKDKLEQIRNSVGSDDYKSSNKLRKVLVKVVQEDFSYLLSLIKVPVFLYWGVNDKDTPIWMARKMRKNIPDCALYEVQKAGHYSFLDDNRIISIMESFFTQ